MRIGSQNKIILKQIKFHNDIIIKTTVGSHKPIQLSHHLVIVICLFRLGQANRIATQVIDTVPLPQESVTQNSQGADRLREVHAHKGTDARTLDLEDIVIWTDAEVVTSKIESQIRQGVTLLAFDIVLACPRFLGTNFLVTAGEHPMLVKEKRKELRTHRMQGTYRSSARVEGKAMREVPVSRITPVSSRSATSLPKAIALKSTSQ